jgi:hypothetical protein
MWNGPFQGPQKHRYENTSFKGRHKLSGVTCDRNMPHDPTLVTPMMNEGIKRRATSGGIWISCPAPTALDLEASRGVRPSGGTVPFGRYHRRENEVPTHNLLARQPVCRRGGGYHHLSTPAGLIHKAKDQAAEPAVPLEGAARSPDPHA